MTSRRHPDVLWTHNDGVKEPYLFAVDEGGALLRAYLIPGAGNTDWEDIAIDEEHRLYILDNTSRIDPQVRNFVYVVPEPNPFVDGQARLQRVLEFDFPDGPFDCEAIFVWKGILYLITKPWDGSLPRVYRFDTERSQGTAQFVGEFPLRTMVTGADISADGTRIAVVSYTALALQTGEADPSKILMTTPQVAPLNARQVEAVAWHGDEVIVTNEEGEIFDVDLEEIAQAKAPSVRIPDVTIPYVLPHAVAETSPSDWPRGRWLRSFSPGYGTRLARLAWNEQGLFVAITLPAGWALRTLATPSGRDYSEWFTPGSVYLLLNPDGLRPLSYGPNDRCILIGRTPEGAVAAQARFLLPATFLRNTEKEPDWLDVDLRDGHLLVSIKPSAPGLRLERDQAIGLNLLMMGQGGEIISWVPLTIRYTWDSPSFWGLVHLNR